MCDTVSTNKSEYPMANSQHSQTLHAEPEQTLSAWLKALPTASDKAEHTEQICLPNFSEPPKML